MRSWTVSLCSRTRSRSAGWLRKRRGRRAGNGADSRVMGRASVRPSRSGAGLDFHSAPVAALDRGGDEVAEQGVGLGRLRLEFGVELDGQEPRVLGQLDDLDQGAVGAHAGGHEAVLLEPLAVLVVELV